MPGVRGNSARSSSDSSSATSRRSPTTLRSSQTCGSGTNVLSQRGTTSASTSWRERTLASMSPFRRSATSRERRLTRPTSTRSSPRLESRSPPTARRHTTPPASSSPRTTTGLPTHPRRLSISRFPSPASDSPRFRTPPSTGRNSLPVRRRPLSRSPFARIRKPPSRMSLRALKSVIAASSSWPAEQERHSHP